MSDTESIAAHPPTGGKSLNLVERPRYKSWRKKFRKMHAKFDIVLEENRRRFKEEQKLEGIAKRLREELDGLLELCLDLNQSSAIPPEQRFDISHFTPSTALASIPNVVPDNITPQHANDLLLEYQVAVSRGQIPPLDLHVIREQIDHKLAQQGITSLEILEGQIPHAVFLGEKSELPEEIRCDDPPAYLGAEQEDTYITRLDAKLGDPLSFTKVHEQQKESLEDKHWADLTPREAERQVELLNPQSQHNWLKLHAKQSGPVAIDIDDTESQASHEVKPARGGAKRNLAKQVGDRAVGRAREGLSPGAASAGFGEDEEYAWVDEHPGNTSKKRGRGDADGTYRLKGGRASTGGGKGKRKRSGEDMAASNSAGKKAKTEGD